jgi:hypothetical protein
MIFWACNKIKENIIKNKIEITVRVNLIHSKLVFQKKIIVHVNVNSASEFIIHCTGFPKEKKCTVHLKKITSAL